MNPHRAVMIVDVQRAFEPPPSFVEKLHRYALRFPCRVYTQFINPQGSMFRRVLKQKSCYPGTPDTDLLLVPEPGDLVFKKAAYGLSPGQIRQLRARGIKRVTVCGLDTDACVLGVLFSLFDAEIECHLKEDLCWSSSGLHGSAMKIVRAQFPKPR
jgi:nicotinamidase-related amidase